MRSHKYIKRTGTPGAYKYWYKLPDGRLVSSDDASSPVSHDKAKAEHIKRLVAGRIHGHHSMTPEQMASHVGTEKKKIQWAISNMSRDGRKAVAQGREGEHFGAKHGHDFENHHMKEAIHADPSGPEYERHTNEISAHAGAAPATPPRARRTPRARAAPAAPTPPPPPPPPAAAAPAPPPRVPPTERHPGHEVASNMGFRVNGGGPSGDSYERYVTHGKHHIHKKANGKFGLDTSHQHLGDTESEHDTLPKAVEHSKRVELENIKRMRARDEDFRSRSSAASAPAAPAAPAPSNDAEEKRKLREKLAREHGIHLGGDTPAAEAAPAQAPATPASEPAETPSNSADRQRASQAASQAAARQASSPASPAGRAMHAADPELAAADAPIERMQAEEAAGRNPYLHRAKEIYNNIRADVKEPRKTVVNHMFQALENLAGRNELNEANLVSEYKRISGKNIRGISGISEQFEKGTFMTLHEILENKPVDPEMERMKRGYAAKQFARMKPFLKDAWLAANRNAPPPYPTYGDIKSWREHGGPRPAWAGNTILALPKEVHDAAAKKDGKPQHPPAWMPIQLAPAWNYIVKKAAVPGSDGQVKNPYQSLSPIVQGRVDAGNQAPSTPEGMAINVLRKYVQMRGGADQLVDIPAHKLSEFGLSHSDIFKSEGGELSDRALKKLICHKIIDPVALQPIIEEEMNRRPAIKKSFVLVVDGNRKANLKKSAFVIDLKKSEMINRIKKLRAVRGKA